jgi:hypothetical protein
VKPRLDAWRAAERNRDLLPPGSTEWQEAADEVTSAQKAYRAEFAQAYVQYAEQDFQTRNSVWTMQWVRHTPSATASRERSA